MILDAARKLSKSRKWAEEIIMELKSIDIKTISKYILNFFNINSKLNEANLIPLDDEEQRTILNIGLRCYLIKDYVDRDEYILNSELGLAKIDSVSTLSTSVNWLKELDRQFELRDNSTFKKEDIKNIEELEISFHLMEKMKSRFTIYGLGTLEHLVI